MGSRPARPADENPPTMRPKLPELIKTSRLILRPFAATDLDAYAAMHADPEVADWLGGTLEREEAEASLKRLQAEFKAQGWGMYVIEGEDGEFLGAAGLQKVKANLPCHPAVEAAWRLTRPAWGKGVVTEAMGAVLDMAYGLAGMKELVTFTAKKNLRSQAVMARLGFHHDPGCDFDHPALPEGHPLRRHVFWRQTAADWKKRAKAA